MSAPSLSAPALVGPASAGAVAGVACAAPFNTEGTASRLPSAPPRRNNSRRVMVDLLIESGSFESRRQRRERRPRDKIQHGGAEARSILLIETPYLRVSVLRACPVSSVPSEIRRKTSRPTPPSSPC